MRAVHDGNPAELGPAVACLLALHLPGCLISSSLTLGYSPTLLLMKKAAYRCIDVLRVCLQRVQEMNLSRIFCCLELFSFPLLVLADVTSHPHQLLSSPFTLLLHSLISSLLHLISPFLSHPFGRCTVAVFGSKTTCLETRRKTTVLSNKSQANQWSSVLWEERTNWSYLVTTLLVTQLRRGKSNLFSLTSVKYVLHFHLVQLVG